MRPALVTGATGFVGSGLVRELARRGHPVHALARASSDRSPLADLDLVWHEADLVDGPAVERAVAAVCDAGPAPWIVHSGAVISYRTGDRELQRAVNVGGTRYVLEAARRHPVGRVLQVSSVVTVGHATGGVALDEDAPFNLGWLGNDYADTKREAEELALGATDELDVVVVNPGAIFGPRGGRASDSNTLRFLTTLARRGAAPIAPPGAMSVVAIGDVVDGCLAALERGGRGRRYLLCESHRSVSELFTLAAELIGARPPRGTVPRALWPLVVGCARIVDRLSPRAMFTPQALGLLGLELRFDSTRARRELGWSPRPFRDVLENTVRWLREDGSIP